MGAFKKLNKQDVFVTSYEAHKSYDIVGSELVTYDVDKFFAFSSSGAYYLNQFDKIIGNSGTSYYSPLVFKSLHQLYYSNFKYGDLKLQSGSFDNYIQSSLATGSYRDVYRELAAETAVITIPQKHFGTNIKPGTFEFFISGGTVLPGYSGSYYSSGSDYIQDEDDYVSLPSRDEQLRSGSGREYIDDGEGNIFISSSDSLDYTGSVKIGDIIYSHGIVSLTDENNTNIINNDLRIKWKATQPIYTYNVRCKVKDYEMNFTQHPTALTGSGLLRDNITGSNFTPYVTSVGLYNDANELLAVAKFGQPIPKTSDTEMTFVVKIDM